MKTQTLFVTLLTLFALFFGSKHALALETPNFPSCSNPQGTVKVSYNEGAHGIVGDSASYTGKDTVYQLDSGNLQQCFCSVNGQGIQTNWWRDSSLTSEERQILINSGWNYVPNGALWGLEGTPYFAKNSNYSCGSGEGVGGGDVLGLASTGGNYLPFILAIIGILSLTSGLLLNRKISGK